MTEPTSGSEFDVLLTGPVFFDIVFTELGAEPAPGTEVWAQGMGSSPGGIANLAVAASRLGLRTALAAGFGDDVYGRWCWEVLAEQEGVDLSRSNLLPDAHSAVTVSIAMNGDRSMITHGHPAPSASAALAANPVRTRAVLADLATVTDGDQGQGEDAWWRRAAAAGALVFADRGWDPTEQWNPADLDPLAHCHAYTPNCLEALAYTRTDSPLAAARALAERVPLAVVTCGPDGAVAVDASTGEEASVPGLRVAALDATGAGDVFSAGLVTGTLAKWSLADRLAFATLCSGLAVQQFGGALAAPGWGDIADWWEAAKASADTEILRRYGFLTDVIPRARAVAVRRAEATFRWSRDRS